MVKFKTEQDFINFVLREFAEQLIEQRIENVRKTKAVASNELMDSYAFEIRKATTQQIANALFAFEARGRYLDMRRINRTNLIPIDVLKEWILKKGLENFKRRPSGPANRKPISDRRFLHELAWGISIKKRGGKHKRKKLQKGFEGLLQEMMSTLRFGYLDRTLDEIKSSVQKNLS